MAKAKKRASLKPALVKREILKKKKEIQRLKKVAQDKKKNIQNLKKKITKKIVKSKKIAKVKPKVVKKLPKSIEKSKKSKVPASKGSTVKNKKDTCVFTGIKGFDVFLGRGIPRGSAVLVEGGPGSGKTNLCLHVAHNFCKSGMKVLYMSFEEHAERLIGHMNAFGWNVKEFQKKGLLRIERFDALDIARSVEALLSAAKKELLIDVQPMLFPRGFNPDLVLVDSLTSISSAFSGEENRFRIYMEQLFRYLERSKITSLLIREVANPAHLGITHDEKGEAISFLSDGIIVVYNVVYDGGNRERAIEILKMRGTNIIRKIVKMEITQKGITVFPNKTLKGKYHLT